jgi:hypothetical protein
VDELVPVILGVVLGALIWRATAARPRTSLSVAAVLVSGTAVTVPRGEYVESWIYVMLDLGEVALGLASGFSLVQIVQRTRFSGRKPSSSS